MVEMKLRPDEISFWDRVIHRLLTGAVIGGYAEQRGEWAIVVADACIMARRKRIPERGPAAAGVYREGEEE